MYIEKARSVNMLEMSGSSTQKDQSINNECLPIHGLVSR
jgi:hypothetical protein